MPISFEERFLDCPICHVFMDQLRPSGSGSWSYRCPLCESKFLINQDPKKREWIIKETTKTGELQDGIR